MLHYDEPLSNIESAWSKRLKLRYEEPLSNSAFTFNLRRYVTDTVDDAKLRELFLEFGTITSCRVMRDTSGARSVTLT